MDKSILDTIRDSANDLYKAGIMTELTLREFDALCNSCAHKNQRKVIDCK